MNDLNDLVEKEIHCLVNLLRNPRKNLDLILLKLPSFISNDLRKEIEDKRNIDNLIFRYVAIYIFLILIIKEIINSYSNAITIKKPLRQMFKERRGISRRLNAYLINIKDLLRKYGNLTVNAYIFETISSSPPSILRIYFYNLLEYCRNRKEKLCECLYKIIKECEKLDLIYRRIYYRLKILCNDGDESACIEYNKGYTKLGKETKKALKLI